MVGLANSCGTTALGSGSKWKRRMTIYLAQVDLANPAAGRAHVVEHGHSAVIAARIVG